MMPIIAVNFGACIWRYRGSQANSEVAFSVNVKEKYAILSEVITKDTLEKGALSADNESGSVTCNPYPLNFSFR